jgi:hypothetical protein
MGRFFQETPVKKNPAKPKKGKPAPKPMPEDMAYMHGGKVGGRKSKKGC